MARVSTRAVRSGEGWVLNGANAVGEDQIHHVLADPPLRHALLDVSCVLHGVFPLRPRFWLRYFYLSRR